MSHAAGDTLFVGRHVRPGDFSVVMAGVKLEGGQARMQEVEQERYAMAASEITKADTRQLLMCAGDPALARMARDVQLVAALTSVLNVTLEAAREFPHSRTQLAKFALDKAVAVSGVVQLASQSRSLEYANFAAGQTLKTLGLISIAGKTPARAATQLTITMVEKIVAVAGLGNVSKCHFALATLSTSAAGAGLACVGSAGVLCALGAVGVAADAFNAYAQCRNQAR